MFTLIFVLVFFFVFELKALAGQTDGMTGQIRNAGY